MVTYKVMFGVLSGESISDKVLVINSDYGDNISVFRPLKTSKFIYDKLEKECKFFSKLEKSILSGGIINPVLCYSVKSGLHPIYGANRVYYAKKHKLEVPCVIADYVDKYGDLEELKSKQDILNKYLDRPTIMMNNNYIHMQGCKHLHLIGN